MALATVQRIGNRAGCRLSDGNTEIVVKVDGSGSVNGRLDRFMGIGG